MIEDDDFSEVVEGWVDGGVGFGEARGSLVGDGSRDSGGAGDGGSFPVVEAVVALSHGGLDLSCALLELEAAIDVSDVGDSLHLLSSVASSPVAFSLSPPPLPLLFGLLSPVWSRALTSPAISIKPFIADAPLSGSLLQSTLLTTLDISEVIYVVNASGVILSP